MLCAKDAQLNQVFKTAEDQQSNDSGAPRCPKLLASNSEILIVKADMRSAGGLSREDIALYWGQEIQKHTHR